MPAISSDLVQYDQPVNKNFKSLVCLSDKWQLQLNCVGDDQGEGELQIWFGLSENGGTPTE